MSVKARTCKAVTILSCLVMFTFSLVYWPLTHLNGKDVPKTDHVVDCVDAMYITMWFAPLGIAVLAHTLLSPDPTNGAKEALSHQSALKAKMNPPTISWTSNMFVPRWKLTERFGSWSPGEVVILMILVVCNAVWWVIPVVDEVKVKGAEMWRVWREIATYAALPGMWNAALALILAVRENHLTKTALTPHGGQYQTAIKFHIGVGYTSLVLLTFHSLYFLISPIISGNAANALLPWRSNRGYLNTWGLISFLAFAIMGATSVYKVRRKAFRWFYWCHQGYVVFLVAASLHEWSSWYYVVGPMLYFVYDRLAGRINVRINTTAAVTKASDDVVKVTIRLSNGYAGSKGYAPGDYINVAFPSISAINWHPFSIASYYPTAPDRITFYVRTGGAWTQKLLTLCDDRAGEPKRVPVKVDGIFGARSTAYLSYDTLVLVGGGTGIAALIPFLKHYAAMHSSGGLTSHGPSMYLIWVARRKADVLVYDEFLADLADSESKLGCHVNLHLHLTRERHRLWPSATLTGVPHGTVERPRLVEGNAPPGNVCDIQIIAETSPGSRSPSRLSTTSKSQPDLCSIFLVLLSLAVFGIGIAVYCLNRILMFGYAKTMCQSRLAYALQRWDHFICWYWYTAPAILPVIVALLSGWIVVIVHSRLQAKRKVGDRWRTEDHAPKHCLPADETTLSQIGFVCGRPEFGRFFDVLERQQAIRDSGVTGILAAGPDRLVRAVENEVVGKRPAMHFYRESWKI